MNKSKTCLFIINKHFYSFEKHIREALEKREYEVTVSNDEYPEGTIGKILGKLQIPIIFSLTYKEINTKYLSGKKYDLILIVKGRGMSARLIMEMKRHSDNIVGYNWDSFNLNRSPLKWFKLTNRYFTFDYRDADKYNLPTIELYSAFKKIDENKAINYEISAVVRNHSGRLKYIDNVMTILNPSTRFIFIFENSVISYLFNFVRNPKLFIKYKKYISFKPLKYSEYSNAISSSEFTIDCAHHTQTGITMRCFEALNVQTRIITNNKYIKMSKSFNDTNFIIYEGKEPNSLLVGEYENCKKKPFTGLSRTIDDFVDDLINK